MWFLLVLLCLLPGQVWAAGSEPNEIFYARPIEECPAFNGNGTLYTCAASNGGNGAFRGLASINSSATPGTDTLGTIDRGDTIYLCGYFDRDSREFDGQMFVPFPALEGTVSSPVVVDGNCSAQGNLSRAVLDGGHVEGRGIDILSGKPYVTWKNFDVKNFLSVGIGMEFDQEPAGHRFEGVDVYDIGVEGAAAGRACVEINSASYVWSGTVSRPSRVGPCGSDGLHVGNGTTGNHTGVIEYVNIRGVSKTLNVGDGIQMEPGGGALTIRNVTVKKFGTDKSCVILAAQNGPAILQGLDCQAEPGAGPFAGIVVDGAGTGSEIRGAYIHDIPGGTGIYIRDDNVAVGGTLLVQGNVIQDMADAITVEGVHPSASIRVHHNTIIGSTAHGLYVATNFNPSSFQVRNNIFYNSALHLRVDGIGDWNSNYNNFSGNGTFSYNSTAYATLALYTAAASQDANSSTTTATFQMHASRPYWLNPNSALRRTGTWTGGDCRDFNGHRCRPPVDPGAFQLEGAGDPRSVFTVR